MILPADISIREMTPADIDAGLRLCRASGWNQTESDWLFFLTIAPHGALVAEENGCVIATTATLPYGPFTWISMVLVDPAARGRGVATTLLQLALGLVDNHAVARLDATPSGEPIYRALGFVSDVRLARWSIDVGSSPIARPIGPRPLTVGDWAAVHEIDVRAFGASRAALLHRLADEAPEYARVLFDRGVLAGYLFGRHGHNREQLGPLVADSDETAVVLLRACLAEHPDRAFFIDVPDGREAWTRTLATLGFQIQRPFVRMHRGRFPAAEHPALSYAITGPEFG
jgi:GNAT superfamily N-acetyltransferase